jgi:O-antigen/teichoic acid export membrane protein
MSNSQQATERRPLPTAVGFAVKLVAFALLILYTHYLSPADFGVLVLLYVTMRILDTVVTQGMTSAVLRAHDVDFKDAPHERREAVSTALFYSVGSAALLFGILALLARPLSAVVTTDEQWAPLLRLMFLAGLLRAAQSVPRQLLQSAGRKRDVIRLLEFATAALLNVYFLVIEGMGLAGIVYSEVAREGVFLIVHAFTLRRTLRPTFSRSHLAQLLRNGLPRVPRGLPLTILSVNDRYFLMHLVGATQLGLYAVAYRFAEIVEDGAVRPLLQRWPRLHAELIADEKDGGQRLLGRFATYLVAIGGLVALGVCVFAEPLLRLAAPPEYLEAARFVPLLSLALLLAGAHRLFLLGLRTVHRTGSLPRMLTAAALLSLVCNAWLVPRHGALGAAVAAMLTSLFLTVVAWRSDRRWFGARVEWDRILRVVVALGLTFTVGRWVTPENLIGQLASACALVLLYPALLGVFGFYSLAELEMLRGLLNRRVVPRAVREGQVLDTPSAIAAEAVEPEAVVTSLIEPPSTTRRELAAARPRRATAGAGDAAVSKAEEPREREAPAVKQSSKR